MIPETVELPAEAEREIEQIDARLDEIDEESRRLLERRSEIIENHA